MENNVKKKIAGLIDHTLLRLGTTDEDHLKICKEAKKYGFRTVCVYPDFVDICVQELEHTSTEVCTVIDFPKGEGDIERNLADLKMVLDQGAMEIDMVMNINAFGAKEYEEVVNGIYAVVEAAEGRIVKVILETCLWNNDQIEIACEIVKDAKAQFVKTSTGFSKHGADISHVKIMRKIVGDIFGVKASGGIRSFNDLLSMIQAGANRIGTSSGINIIKGINAH
jgi:deoxyribose-phosphate aldolase